MNFQERLLPTSPDLAFREEGYYVWGASMFRWNGAYYLCYARWKKEYGFDAWVTHSEIALAKSDRPDGRFVPVKKLFPVDGASGWDRDCAHNPTVIQWKGRIVLYYMANYGNGEYWNHRNHQRIGCAWTTDPEGEWSKSDGPVIDISAEGVDSLMTSNPSACVRPDGRILMVYKAVSKYGAMPKGGDVICAAALAPEPWGPFEKFGEPLMVNPENGWSVEDPFIWYDRFEGCYYALVKDFQGYFTGAQKGSTALFTSLDGRHWGPSEHPLAYERVIDFGDHRLPVDNLERPQIYFEDGHPAWLLCATRVREEDEDTFNLRIPMKEQP